MDKIWLKSYPAGVPAEIDEHAYSSLVHLIESSLSQYANRSAFVCMGKSISYAELDLASKQFGAYLQSLGLQRGARVALMMPNILQYPVALFAALRAGYVVVNVNPLYTPRELEHQLKDSGAETIVILENFATTLQEVLPHTQIKHVVVASMGEMLGTVKGAIVNLVVRHVKKLVPAWRIDGHVTFHHALSQGAGLHFKKAEVTRDDIAFLQYTGGTTGVAKGATLLHRNLIANVMQSKTWLLAGQQHADANQQLNFVCALPLYHIFALNACAMMALNSGAKVLLIPNPRDIPGFIKELQHYKSHIFPAVNTLFNALLNHPDFSKADFSELKVAIGGGMATLKAVSDKWQAATGVAITEAYGLSETSPGATGNIVGTGMFTGTIGLPFPSTEVVMLDDNGVEVPLGQPGEISIRGPQVMAGYWNRPDETAKVMTPDGFFKTGDIGVMDERGYIKIVDRKKDMILVSGFNVYPNEIEEVMAMHPGVLESAAVGVPDENSGEAVKVYVVKKDPAVTEAELKAFCHAQLTGYKRPKYIEFRKELPKTNVGKILRRELRDKPTA